MNKWKSENKQYVAEYNKEWFAAHPNYKAEYNKKWRAAHPDYHDAYHKAHAEKERTYYETHKTSIVVRLNKYRGLHPEVARAASERRRALKKECEGKFTEKEWLAMLVETGYRCVYCGLHSNTLTMEHVIPLTKGGRHDASNIVPACKRCNSRKKDKSLLMFLYAERERG